MEKREVTAWGTRAEKSSPVYRSLWSTLAPKWMVVTLAVDAAWCVGPLHLCYHQP
ncbi:MAG: hypothetical protein MZV63_53225 [Marinilabiliales bacterium]|nr:hypothetical protein [Marinilabiliales bacterium]